MKNLIQKIKLFYTETTRREEKYKRKAIKPIHNWSVIVSVDIIVFCILGVSAFYFYYQIDNDKLFTTNKTGELREIGLNLTLLKTAIEDVNLREELAGSLTKGGLKSPDPSL